LGTVASTILTNPYMPVCRTIQAMITQQMCSGWIYRGGCRGEYQQIHEEDCSTCTVQYTWLNSAFSNQL